MRETKNKSTVNHGCGSHAILRCGETMVDVQDAGITKDFGKKNDSLPDISLSQVGKKRYLF